MIAHDLTRFRKCENLFVISSCDKILHGIFRQFPQNRIWIFGVYHIFLHGNSLRKAVWSRKIHVQIMRFTCCLNMAFTWKSLNWALICMHDVTLESVAAVTDHFADAFVRENVARVYMTLWRRNGVRNLTLTPFCFEKSSVRKGIFNV